MTVESLLKFLIEPPPNVEDTNIRVLAKISLTLQLVLIVLFIARDILVVGGYTSGTAGIITIGFLITYLIGLKFSHRISTVGALVVLSLIPITMTD